MTIGNGEYGIVGRTTDGKRGILPIASVTATGQLALPFRTTDGSIALMRVAPADADAQFAFPGRMTDGGIGLFKPYPTTPSITCNSCDPPMQSEYTVFLSGLMGDFATYNGMHTVMWDADPPHEREPCAWVKWFGTPGSNPYLELYYEPVSGYPGHYQWTLFLQHADDCNIYWATAPDPDPCTPTDDLFDILVRCVDTGCADTNTCEGGTPEDPVLAAGPDCGTCVGDTPISWTIEIDGVPPESPCHDELAGTHDLDRHVGFCTWYWSGDLPNQYPKADVFFAGGNINCRIWHDSNTFWFFQDSYGAGDPCQFSGAMTLVSQGNEDCAPEDLGCAITPNFA
ncbi:MAG: hypothetical protein V2A79_02945 [Planctomycetota bacterium]